MAKNITYNNFTVDATVKAGLKNQKPMCIWITGLSGAGKTSIANELDKKLTSMNKHSFILDGDNLRHGVNSDLYFCETDRAENIRRTAEIAKLMTEAGLIVIVCLISPLVNQRLNAKKLFQKNMFLEVYLSTSLVECEKRDIKGLYKKARAGIIEDFTGINSPYEPPKKPDLEINTEFISIEEAVNLILAKILK
jgi:adenylyl-sulfate kinase